MSVHIIALGPKMALLRGSIVLHRPIKGNVKIKNGPPPWSYALQRLIKGKREKIFLSETRRPRLLIFGV